MTDPAARRFEGKVVLIVRKTPRSGFGPKALPSTDDDEHVLDTHK